MANSWPRCSSMVIWAHIAAPIPAAAATTTIPAAAAAAAATTTATTVGFCSWMRWIIGELFRSSLEDSFAFLRSFFFFGPCGFNI